MRQGFPFFNRVRLNLADARRSSGRTAHDIDPKLQLECMGSYRRGAESSGDIDCASSRRSPLSSAFAGPR